MGHDVHLRSFGLATLEVGNRELPSRWIELLRQCVVRQWLEVDNPGGEQHRGHLTGVDEDAPLPANTPGNQFVDNACQARPPEMAETLRELLKREFGDWSSSSFVSGLNQFLLQRHSSCGTDSSLPSDCPAPELAMFVADVARQLSHLVSSLGGPTGTDDALSSEHRAAYEQNPLSARSCPTDRLDRQLGELIPELAEDLAARLLSQFLEIASLIRQIGGDGLEIRRPYAC